MILGLDISTSITGVAVVSDDQILYYDSIDLRKHKDVFAKAIEMKAKKWNPTILKNDYLIAKK